MPKLGGSLFQRLTLLVLLTVLATQMFTWWIVIGERRELMAKQLYIQVIDTLADLEGRLDPIAPGDRLAYLTDYNRPGLTELLPLDADRGVNFSPELPPLEQKLAQRLSDELGSDVEARVAQFQQQRQLWLKVSVLGDDYWLVVPMGRFRDDIASSMTLAALLASLCAILVASAIAWHTIVPIRRVAAATRDLEHGRTPKKLAENQGPLEVRALAQGFNRMAHALEVSASERRLMLAGLSHDLRTPLTRLKLMLELLHDSDDKSDMLADIDELAGMVRQFIDFARSEEKPRSELVALAELASSVVARFAREQVKVQLTVLAEPEIQADPWSLERLLGNLLENARRYGRNPIEVEISLEAGQAVLKVSDHGDGIPPEQREAALAPFERLVAHRGTDGGSGLGLAIVARIVKQHEGSLQLLDAPGGGLCVRIALPLPHTSRTPPSLFPTQPGSRAASLPLIKHPTI